MPDRLNATHEVTYTLTVNGARHTVHTEPRKLLLDVLRENLGLTGPHPGCEHGVCGACTVMMDGRTVRSCLMFGVQAAHASILTIEGLGRGGSLHPLQEEFSRCHAVQCGYCTPGMILTAVSLLGENPSPTVDEIKDYMAGNLCRCATYVDVIGAVLAASERLR